MSERLNKVLLAASMAGVASFTISCSSSTGNNRPPVPKPVTSLSPKLAYDQAHCEDMIVKPPLTKSGLPVVSITGYARVAADYGIVVTENPGTPSAISKATIFKHSTSAHSEVVQGPLALPDSGPGITQFDIEGIVTPAGYAGQLMTSKNCSYTLAFQPNPTTQP